MGHDKASSAFDEMRASSIQTAANEQALVRSLGDALSHIDQQLLLDVRRFAADHEARRAAIFNELQALACSIGMFSRRPKWGAIPQQMGTSISQLSAIRAQRRRTSAIRTSSNTSSTAKATLGCALRLGPSGQK